MISGEERGTGHGHGESEKAAFSKEEADTALEYTLVDYRFEGPMTAKGPKLFFIAQNKGTEDHELEILDDRGKALGEIEAFAPEDGPKTLAIELRPGTYTLQCILETPQGGVHRELGMVTELVVE